jgi:fatty acid desaturase
VIAVAIALNVIIQNPVFYLVAIIVIGSRMRALANLLHEAAHNKLFANRTVNDLTGRLLCAWPVLVAYKKYVADHRFHHKYLWRDGKDPDRGLYLLTRTMAGSSARLSYKAFLVRHVLLVVVPVMPTWRLLRESIANRQRMITLGIVAGLALLVSLFGPGIASQIFVYCWVIPWFTTFQCVTYWAELGEHGGLVSFGWSWGSRNWYGNLIIRWLIGSHSDDLYHLLHHWFPSVPHYRLRLLDSECKRNWPEYSRNSRCSGFFRGGNGQVSVLRDIWAGGAVNTTATSPSTTATSPRVVSRMSRSSA